MFGKPRRNEKQLPPPPIAEIESQATEVLRVWAAPGKPQQVTLRVTWKDPGAWGLMLVDIARHATRAYAKEGHDPAAVLARIREMFDADWSGSPDTTSDIDNS